MATKNIYTLDYGYETWPYHLTILEYGECEQQPYADEGLWYVTIPSGSHWKRHIRDEMRFPNEPHTYLVPSWHILPQELESRKRHISRWEEVAKYKFVGSFCPRFEILWKEVPVHLYEIPNGNTVKYGYCRTQLPDRELWFISFKKGSYGVSAGTFVVDEMCIRLDFIDRMGDDLMKWMIICLCKLDEGNEVHYDDLKTGTLDGGYVRSNEEFGLDSPYTPASTDIILMRIEKYEEYLDYEISEYDRRSHRLFSKLPRLEKLPEIEKSALVSKWAQKAARKAHETIK